MKRFVAHLVPSHSYYVNKVWIYDHLKGGYVIGGTVSIFDKMYSMPYEFVDTAPSDLLLSVAEDFIADNEEELINNADKYGVIEIER